MNSKEYEQFIKPYQPKDQKWLRGLTAFIVGGLVGALGELLINIYSYVLNLSRADAGIFMIISLIFIAVLCTGLGFFDRLVIFCQAGLIIPITGFAHSIMSAVMDYKTEGLIMGIGSNIFKLAGSVILYGVVSAYIFGLIRLMVLGG